MTFRVLSVFVLLVSAVGCGDTPTTPTAIFTTTSQFFVNGLNPGASSVYTFSTTGQSFFHVTFASLVSAASGEPIEGNIVLGLGTSTGGTCTTTTTQNVTPSLAAQIRSSSAQAPGNYCIRVADGGGLAEPAVFAARVTVTSALIPEGGLGFIESFSSSLPKGGSVIHTFEASRSGNSSVTLSSARAEQVLRLGMGLWDGAVCRTSYNVDTVAGSTPQLVSGMDPGTYCVSLRDAAVANQTSFTITIARP